MTSTNIKKLVGWDIDTYLSLDDTDGCLVCLTPRDRYVLGQATRQMRWATRWDTTSGASTPDLDAVSDRMDYLMSDDACIDLCQAIIDCIDDPDSGVGERISQLASSVSYDDSRALAQSYNNTSLGDGSNPTCDLDILFGQSLQLVEYLDESNRQLLEVLEVITNSGEWVSEVIGDVTGADEISIDAILAWIAFVQQSIADNYEAQITTQYIEARACDIFCIAQDNDCKIDPATLYQIWQDRLNSQVTIGSVIGEALTYIFTGTWTGSEIADVMFFAQLAFRSMVGEWLGNIAYTDIDLRLRVYGNDPNEDWVVLCDDCPQDLFYNFAVSNQNWSVLTGVIDGQTYFFGLYDEDNGYFVSDDNANNWTISIGRNPPAELDISEIIVDYYMDGNGGAGSRTITIWINDQAQRFDANLVDGRNQITIPINDTALATGEIQVTIRAGFSSVPGEARLYSLRVIYT